MRVATSLVLLLAAAALVSAAPAPDYDDEYYDDSDYYDYDGAYDDDDDDDDDDRHASHLTFDIFRDRRAKPPSAALQAYTSPCTWAVVQCCDVPHRMSHRAFCFERLGCRGAWFTDICTPQIKYNVLRAVILASRNT